jgi:hypothetical protein
MVVRDDDRDEFTVDTSLVLAPGAYAVFGCNGNPGGNGGVLVDYAYAYADFMIANTADEIELVVDGQVIDRVAYDGTWPFDAGVAMSLDPAQTATDLNDDPDNWCEADQAYGEGDRGTPGAENPPCPTLP